MRSGIPAIASPLICGRRIEKSRDEAVLGKSAKELETLRGQGLVGQQLIARRRAPCRCCAAGAARGPTAWRRRSANSPCPSTQTRLGHRWGPRPGDRASAPDSGKRAPAWRRERNSECRFPAGPGRDHSGTGCGSQAPKAGLGKGSPLGQDYNKTNGTYGSRLRPFRDTAPRRRFPYNFGLPKSQLRNKS